MTSRHLVASAPLLSLLALVGPVAAGTSASEARDPEPEEVIVAYPSGQVTFGPGERVELWASERPLVTLVGPFLTATHAEIRSVGGGILGGSSAAIEKRTPPTPLVSERISVRIGLNSATTPGGDYELRVDLPVGGPTTVPLRIYETGRIDGIEQTGGALKDGQVVELTLSGQQLGQAAIEPVEHPDPGQAGFTDVERVQGSVGSAVLRLRLTSPGELFVEARSFFDGRQGEAPDRLQRHYSGSGFGSWSVEPAPVMGDVTPSETQRGELITVAGYNLDMAGATESGIPYAWQLVYPDSRGREGFTEATDVGETRLRFRVPPDAMPGAYAVTWDQGRTRLPVELSLLLPPVLEGFHNVTLGSSLHLRAGDILEIRGENLSLGGASPIVRSDAVQLPVADASDPSALRVRVPDALPQGDNYLTVETAAGSVTSRSFLYMARPPEATRLRMQEGHDPSTAGLTFRDVDDGIIHPGRSYEIEGDHLSAPDVADEVPDAQVRVGTLELAPRRPPSRRTLQFRLPDETPLGPVEVVVETFAGEASLGTFQVAENPARMSDLVVEPHDAIVPGDELEAHVLFENPGPPPPDGRRVQLSAPSVLDVPAEATIQGGEAVFTIRAGAVERSEVVYVTAEHDGRSTNAGVRVAPPPPARPVELALEHSGVVGDNRLGATLVLDRDPLPGQSVALRSSDPAVARVPASVPANAREVGFEVATGSVEAVREVQLTAELGGASVSARLRVSPRAMRLSALRVPSDRIVAPARFPVEIRIANQTAASEPVDVALRGSQGLKLPSRVRVTGGSATFEVSAAAVAGLTRASIEARSPVGEVEVSFALEPLAVADLRASPETLRVRESGEVLVTLSAPAPTDLALPVTVSDATVLSAPKAVKVPRGARQATLSVQGLAASPAKGVLLSVTVPEQLVKEPASIPIVVR